MYLFTAFHILIFLVQFLIYFKIKKNFKIKLWQNILFFALAIICLSKIKYIRGFISEHFLEFHIYTQAIYFVYVTFCLFFLIFLFLNSFLAFILNKLKKFKRTKISERKIVGFTIILSMCLMILGFYNSSYNIKVKHHVIESNFLNSNIDKLRIVQLSDIHLDHLTGPKTLKRIAKLVEKQKPDIIVITGDLVDTNVTKRYKDAEILKSMKSTYGNFAVLGNHEIYSGYDISVKFHKDAGLNLLEGENVEVGGIIISGVSDPATARIKTITNELALLQKEQNKNKFILLLKHQPRIEEEAFGMFDLALTGHTHHGQVWPFHYIVQMDYPLYVRGLSKLKKNNKSLGQHAGYIYNSAGTGFWGPPIRFLAPAEITVIDITNNTN